MFSVRKIKHQLFKDFSIFKCIFYCMIESFYFEESF